MTVFAGAADGYRMNATSSIDRAIRLSTAAAVLAVAGIAAYVSYWHAYAVVRAHGESGITARLEPATIDGLVYASSMMVLYAARHRVPVPSLARWLLGLGIAATLTANMAQGWSHGLVGAVVAAWPAVSLVGSYELLVWLIRTSGTAEHRPPAEHLCEAPACRAAVLAQPPLPVVHRCGEFGGVPVGVRVAGLRDLAGPRADGEGGHPVGVLADPPVQHLGHRLGAGQRPGRGRTAEQARAVDPGGLGFAQGAPQPGGGRVGQDLPGLLVGQCGADGGFVAVLGGVAGDVLPLHAEHVEPVGVRPFRGPGVGGGQLLPVPVQAPGQDLLRRHSWFVPSSCLCYLAGVEPGVFPVQAFLPGQLRGGLGSWLGVGDPPSGDHERLVVLPATGHRHIGGLPVLLPGEHRDTGIDRAPLGRVERDCVSEMRLVP